MQRRWRRNVAQEPRVDSLYPSVLNCNQKIYVFLSVRIIFPVVSMKWFHLSNTEVFRMKSSASSLLYPGRKKPKHYHLTINVALFLHLYCSEIQSSIEPYIVVSLLLISCSLHRAVTVGVPVPSEGIIDIPIIEKAITGPQPHYKVCHWYILLSVLYCDIYRFKAVHLFAARK